LTPAPRAPRVRLDVLLVERGLASTRAKAQALILAGRVASSGVRLDKPGRLVDPGVALDLAPSPRFVSRGGEKLAPVLAGFGVNPEGRDTLDVGASTGGFTDALLQAGARRVAAVDVGHGQLDWTLRNDPRVVVIEGVNARHLEPARLPFRPSLAVIDVSFISLRQVLGPVCTCLALEAEVVALVKPQFEVGRGRVGRGGVVRDVDLWREVLEGLLAFARLHALGPSGVLRSPLPGVSGNVEFFLHLRPGETGAADSALQSACREATRGQAPS
jgi:23S rRNA (cytidine1920-2'-O)/16S rRNA (cytidine1409-2'-O)-methyltransferase